MVPLLLIAAGTSAAAALSTPAAEEEDEPEAEGEDVELELAELVGLGAGAAGLLPLPQAAAGRATVIAAAPTMTALGVLPAPLGFSSWSAAVSPWCHLNGVRGWNPRPGNRAWN